MMRGLLLFASLANLLVPLVAAAGNVPVHAQLAPHGTLAARGELGVTAAERWWASFGMPASSDARDLLQQRIDVVFRSHDVQTGLRLGTPRSVQGADGGSRSVRVEDAQVRITDVAAGAQWWTAGESGPGAGGPSIGSTTCDFSLFASWSSTFNGFHRSHAGGRYPDARPLAATCGVSGPADLIGDTVLFWNTALEINGRKPASEGAEEVTYRLTSGKAPDAGTGGSRFVQVTFLGDPAAHPLDPAGVTLVASAFHVDGRLALLPGRGAVTRGDQTVIDPDKEQGLEGVFVLRHDAAGLDVEGFGPSGTAPILGPGSLLLAAVAVAALPVGVWSLARRLGLFALLGRGVDHALKHPHRKTIHAIVMQEPGISMRDMVRRMGVPRTTVRHHLLSLARSRLVELQTFGREICAFPPRVPEADQLRLRLIQTPRSRAIVSLFRQVDSLTQAEVQRHLSLSQPQVSRLVSQLERAGLLRSEWGLGRRRYRLAATHVWPTGSREGATESRQAP